MTGREDSGAATAAREFLDLAPQFRLGNLPTEMPHPRSGRLSELAVHDPGQALGILQGIDADALDVLVGKREGVLRLAEAIRETLASGHDVHLAGCGLTGRLALVCEALWRRANSGLPERDRVRSFMAGGDAALVRLVESFEDHPEYGERQLREAGFREGDLLIASSEGGETPFVIGAVERAAADSSRSPYFLYCNPDDMLARTAQRSAQVLANPRVAKLNLAVGPMALAGSTRMQASTVLMAAIGEALLACRQPESIAQDLEELAGFWKTLDAAFLAPFLSREAGIYQAGKSLVYESDADSAITILTDTTERSPTFGLVPFRNSLEGSRPPSLCTLRLPDAPDNQSAWRMVLERDARPLMWTGYGPWATRAWLLGFDFSGSDAGPGGDRSGPVDSPVFSIRAKDGNLEFALEELSHQVPTGRVSDLSRHLVLKMLLNAHSTLVMGRLGRFEGNLMTWVRPTNKKLIDRAIRYADGLLGRQGRRVPYEALALACFELRDALPDSQSLVHAMVARFAAGGT